jgi:hypothetical protein
LNTHTWPSPAAKTVLVVLLTATAAFWGAAAPASAHRDGCHRWHSCPSDTGSYVCGDTGHFSECGYDSLPGPELEPEPEAPADYEAPSAPEVRNPETGAGGAVAVTVTAERGSVIEVRDEGGTVVRKTTATGSAQRMSFTAEDGEHTYTAVAVDAAGNTSDEGEGFTVTVDTRKPGLGKPAVSAADPSTGAVTVGFTAEADARYSVTVQGRGERLTGTVAADGRVTGALALPNGTYRLLFAVLDAAGNASRATVTTAVSLTALEPRLRLSGSPVGARVGFEAVGPSRGTGTLTVGGVAHPVTLDAAGRSTVAAELEDGTYRAALAVRDPFGRRGNVRSAEFTVDATPPALTVSYDTEQARYGDAVVTVTGEAGARITFDVAGTDRESATLTGGTHVFRPRLAPGEHRIAVTATDRFGNTTHRAITVRVSDELTSGETTRALLGALGVLLFLALVGLLLWRRRRRFIVWVARRQQAAFIASRERAAERYESELASWQQEHDRLAELHDLAAHLSGEEPSAAGFPWGRRKAGERVLLAFPAELVKSRTRQGQQYTERAEAGQAAVTDQRVLFSDGAARREWSYAKWLHHDHREAAAETMIMVSNRQKSSGLAYSRADAPRVRLVIDLALATSRGDRALIVERTRRTLADHERRRPQAPAMV